jgi:hypothetical protein
VEHTRDSHDMLTSGVCYKLVKVDVENGPTSLVCYAGLLEDEFGGFGMQRTTSGQRFIPKCKSAGFMSTHVKKHGITHDCTPMDGERR